MIPSIKGLAIAGLVEDLNRWLREGRASEHRLAKHLEPGDLALLEDGFDPFRWYPIETYERLTAALRDVTKERGVDWLCARGAAAARRLLEGGLHQQLDSLKRGDASWNIQSYASRIRLIVTLHNALLDFSHWQVEEDPRHPERVRIVITGAERVPEILRHVIEGFVNACAEEAGSGARWRSERPEDGRIVLAMDRDFSA